MMRLSVQTHAILLEIPFPRFGCCTHIDMEETYERFHRGLVQTPDARRLRGRRCARRGARCFHRRLGDAGLVRSLAAGLEHQSAAFVLSAAEGGSRVQRERAEEG